MKDAVIEGIMGNKSTSSTKKTEIWKQPEVGVGMADF